MSARGSSAFPDSVYAVMNRSNAHTWRRVLGFAGGVSDIVRDAMQARGWYDRFVTVTEREHALAFKDGLVGEDIPFALPLVRVPTQPLGNFTACP